MSGPAKNSVSMIIIANWREYITVKALWYSKIPDEMKIDPEFHEDLAQRINEIIARILSEPPSEEQIVAIQSMQEELDTHYEYHCKAEAYTLTHC